MTRVTLVISLVLVQAVFGLAQGRDDRSVFEALLRELFDGAVPPTLVVQVTPLPILPLASDPTALVASDWDALGPDADVPPPVSGDALPVPRHVSRLETE